MDWGWYKYMYMGWNGDGFGAGGGRGEKGGRFFCERARPYLPAYVPFWRRVSGLSPQSCVRLSSKGVM